MEAASEPAAPPPPLYSLDIGFAPLFFNASPTKLHTARYPSKILPLLIPITFFPRDASKVAL